MAKRTLLVFLSYSTVELDFVQKLSRDLEQADVKNWYAKSIPGGVLWGDEVTRVLTKCSKVVCVLSPNWIASEWAKKEWYLAEELEKKPVPIRYKDHPPHILLAGVQEIDFREDYQAGFAELVGALKALKPPANSKKSSKKQSAPGGKPPISSVQPPPEKPVALPPQSLTDTQITGGQQDAAWQGMMANLRPQEIAVERAVGAVPEDRHEHPATGQDGLR